MDNWKLKFAVIWSGQAISIFTSAILQMALIWHMAVTTNSSFVLSIASIAAFLPMAVLGSFAGALVDRWNRKYTAKTTKHFKGNNGSFYYNQET